jgi:histidinol-phosphate aminotransferase
LLLPRANIAALKPGVHGGVNYGETLKAGLEASKILDFSTNLNPFGPPPGLKNAICRAVIDCYPDSESNELRNLIARRNRLGADQILVGSGSTELIRLIAQTYLAEGDTVFVPEPTYGDYETASQIAGANIIKERVIGVDFRVKMTAISDSIKSSKPKAVFICNPNNPTGQYLPAVFIEGLLKDNQDVLLVLDEAYIAFTENAWDSNALVKKYRNLAILRSMTKDFAIAGLRLGYLISSPGIVSEINKVKPPWNVSSAAQAAGLFVLKADGYSENCAIKIKKSKDFLVRELSHLGLKSVPSQTNFFLVKVGDAPGLKLELFKKGLLVRDCTSFGLPEYIRISPRKIGECKKLVRAIGELTGNVNAG